MDLKTIDQMIANSQQAWEINSMLMRHAKKEKSPDGFLFALAIVKYIRIKKRLEQTRINYL